MFIFGCAGEGLPMSQLYLVHYSMLPHGIACLFALLLLYLIYTNVPNCKRCTCFQYHLLSDRHALSRYSKSTNCKCLTKQLRNS